MNRIETPTPFWMSASVCRDLRRSTPARQPVRTVRPSTWSSRSTTDDRTEIGEPVRHGLGAGHRFVLVIERHAGAATRREPRRDRRVEVGGTSLGCSRSTGSRGPVCEPGSPRAASGVHQEHPGAARPCGPVPTQTSTGTGSSDQPLAQRHAVLPDRARAIHLQDDHRVVGDRGVELVVQVPRSGRSIAPSTLITATLSPAGSCACAAAAETVPATVSSRKTTRERRMGRTIVPRRGVSSAGIP